MLDVQASRRGFVRGAAIGASALLVGCGDGGQQSSGIAVVPGPTSSIPGYRPDPAEVAKWQGAVGQSFMLTGKTGTIGATLESVEGQMTADKRPDDLRQQTFVATFTIDPSAVTTGNEIFTASSATLPTASIFMLRGADRASKGTLVAVFG